MGTPVVFVLAAPAGLHGDGAKVVAETDDIGLWDLMEADEQRWSRNRVPMYDPRTRQHVADAVITIVAQRALRSLWEMKGRDA